jgi:hypothetical protein
MGKFDRFVHKAPVSNRRDQTRREACQFVEIETTAGTYVVELINLSAQGLCVRMTNMPIPPIDSPIAVSLIAGEVVLGFLRWVGNSTAGIEFASAIDAPEAKTEVEYLGQKFFSRTLMLQAKRRAGES